MSAWEDKLAIAEVVQNWALWRDFGDWERLRTTYHPEGIMTTTRSSGPASEFIAAAAQRHGRGLSKHLMGGSSVRVNGAKALAESQLILLSRAKVVEIDVDVTCYGRFYDRFVRHEGSWCILRRNVIYEKDRIDTVRPGVKLELDEQTLARFPEGYRHLAYVQSKGGAQVDPELPTSRGAALERLYREAEAWLASG
jgi:hypothetical protein